MENTNEGSIIFALFEAIQNGKLPTVERLYWKAAKLDKKDKGGNTLLMVALYYQQFNIANWLMERQPTLLKETNTNGDTPLTFCAYTGQLEGVQWLVNKGVYLHEKNSQGQSAYDRAKSENQMDILAWLKAQEIKVSQAASQYINNQQIDKSTNRNSVILPAAPKKVAPSNSNIIKPKIALPNTSTAVTNTNNNNPAGNFNKVLPAGSQVINNEVANPMRRTSVILPAAPKKIVSSNVNIIKPKIALPNTSTAVTNTNNNNPAGNFNKVLSAGSQVINNEVANPMRRTSVILPAAPKKIVSSNVNIIKPKVALSSTNTAVTNTDSNNPAGNFNKVLSAESQVINNEVANPMRRTSVILPAAPKKIASSNITIIKPKIALQSRNSPITNENNNREESTENKFTQPNISAQKSVVETLNIDSFNSSQLPLSNNSSNDIADGKTLLDAVAIGDINLASRLYQKGESLLQKDSNGNTLIMLALWYKQFDLAQWLLEQCPKLLTAPCTNKHTPLSWAQAHQREDIIQWLSTRVTSAPKPNALKKQNQIINQSEMLRNSVNQVKQEDLHATDLLEHAVKDILSNIFLNLSEQSLKIVKTIQKSVQLKSMIAEQLKKSNFIHALLDATDQATIIGRNDLASSITFTLDKLLSNPLIVDTQEGLFDSNEVIINIQRTINSFNIQQEQNSAITSKLTSLPSIQAHKVYSETIAPAHESPFNDKPPQPESSASQQVHVNNLNIIPNDVPIDKDTYAPYGLFEAAMKGNIPRLEYLLNQGIPLQKRDEFGDTVVFKALKHGQLKVVQWLLQNGVSLDEKSKHGYTALSYLQDNFQKSPEYQKTLDLWHKSMTSGLTTTVAPIIPPKKDLWQIQSMVRNLTTVAPVIPPKQVSNEKNSSISSQQISYTSPVVKKETLSTRASISNSNENTSNSAKYSVKKTNALHKAVLKNDLAKVKKIIAKRKCPIDAGNEKDSSALILACCIPQCSVEIIKTLIDAGANVNHQNNSSQTPLLSVVCNRKNVALIDLLIEKGADIDYKSKNGISAFMGACIFQSQPDVVEALFHYVENLEDITTSGNTALALACMFKRKPTIKFLLEQGANPNNIQPSEYKKLNADILNLIKTYSRYPLTVAPTLTTSVNNNKEVFEPLRIQHQPTFFQRNPQNNHNNHTPLFGKEAQKILRHGMHDLVETFQDGMQMFNDIDNGNYNSFNF